MMRSIRGAPVLLMAMAAMLTAKTYDRPDPATAHENIASAFAMAPPTAAPAVVSARMVLPLAASYKSTMSRELPAVPVTVAEIVQASFVQPGASPGRSWRMRQSTNDLYITYSGRTRGVNKFRNDGHSLRL